MKSNTVLLIILTLVLAGGAYWYFSSQSGNQAPLTTATVSGGAAETQFQVLITQLRSISFKTAIFSDAKFTSLVTLSVPVTSEPIGRLDPFASIPGITTGI